MGLEYEVKITQGEAGSYTLMAGSYLCEYGSCRILDMDYGTHTVKRLSELHFASETVLFLYKTTSGGGVFIFTAKDSNIGLDINIGFAEADCRVE